MAIFGLLACERNVEAATRDQSIEAVHPIQHSAEQRVEIAEIGEGEH